ncbi:hypothetical protein BDA99DRAFT_93179 [Phascolomyces articulosus]|uniref:Transmembrane protein n=1 Tax=Phascolomyces articulosus TaxID=60185 RepID=A0AAD5K785_9FUNG|nr:hypothetical protein BDA99DRAFT_93179 [Phascolomyces articulosus]
MYKKEIERRKNNEKKQNNCVKKKRGICLGEINYNRRKKVIFTYTKKCDLTEKKNYFLLLLLFFLLIQVEIILIRIKKRSTCILYMSVCVIVSVDLDESIIFFWLAVQVCWI